MVFESILYAGTGQKAEKSEPAYFQDLRLDYLMGILERSVKEYAVQTHYYTLPATRDLIRYRHEVFRDLSQPALYECVRGFCRNMQKSRRASGLAGESGEALQAAGCHLEAAAYYWKGLLSLAQGLEDGNPASEGIRSLREYLEEHIAQLRQNGFEEALRMAERCLSQIRFHFVADGENITIEEITEETADQGGESIWQRNYLQELAELLSLDTGEENDIQGIFPNTLEPSYLELTMIQIQRKSNPDILKGIRGFHQSFPQFYSDKILRFEEEVPFYISFLEFKKNTEKLGYFLNEPQVSGDHRFCGEGVYDLALVWKHAGRDYTIVPNDFSYPERPSFFAVTGPNQGGKTTFARSVAQAVYLSLMGLYVNADTFQLPWFQGIATHFEMEEKLQSNSGKLKDEIDRLAPMLHQHRKRQFIVLNELFTTATTHDALIMGRKVMQYFLMRECCGIYVTHIQELAEETESIVSLVAQVEPGGENKRTYRILPGKAQGYGYSDSLVEQFSLRYEDLMRRLE